MNDLMHFSDHLCTFTTRMTETESENPGARQRKGDAPSENLKTRDDAFDDTYKEKEGPKPPTTIVWKNVILMTLLHVGALYGGFLIPSASPLTLVWCEYRITY